MYLKKQISLFLLLVFLSPLAEQFLHTLQEHHHAHCESKEKQHLCSQEEKCDICFFQFQNGKVENDELHLHKIICCKKQLFKAYHSFTEIHLLVEQMKFFELAINA